MKRRISKRFKDGISVQCKIQCYEKPNILCSVYFHLKWISMLFSFKFPSFMINCLEKYTCSSLLSLLLDLNRAKCPVESFCIHETKKWESILSRVCGKNGNESNKNPERESVIAAPTPLSICSRRWVSVWSKSLPVCRSRPWNYLITTVNTVANCCLLIGQCLTAMAIWWEMIYPPAIFFWVMSAVKMITSFNHALFA